MSKANRYWDRNQNRWVFTDKGGNQIAVFGTETSLYGVDPVARQSHLADPVKASYGAVASAAGEVAVADLNAAIGSITYMIRSVQGGVASLNSALETIGILKTS